MSIDNATSAPDIAAPPDAEQVHEWVPRGEGLAIRVFDGTVREAAGFTIQVGGVQHQNGTCRRWVAIEAAGRTVGAAMEPESLRQLSAALSAAADEIEARR
ncbi:MAG: hypothetical protein JOZ00_07100 [Mycobacterium sp.]|uniref:hypothetical protein n=1 Tax=Mycobacterium sp. TaxID=1785 RepID=UPI001EB85937|nr:hypothetical protein [Mycobacterium sp.]MBV8786440.1 hypothetical protein [Mycobacterium sp.]